MAFHWNRKKAVELMREHVGPGYVVLEEKEVVTGQETTNHSDTQNELGVHSTVPVLPANKQITTTTTTTRDLTEWHIVYRRGGTPPPAVADSPARQNGGRK
jgi:flagellar biosynthesis GTPase FlhF